MSVQDSKTREKQAGQKAALKLRKSLKSVTRSIFETTSGNSEILKSTVLSRMKGPELQRLVIKAPHYAFKQHFGFEGVRSNGVKLKLISNVGYLADAMQANNALEDLATEIGEIRADEVISLIKF